MRMPEPGKRPGECPHQLSQGHFHQPVNARTLAHMPTLTHTNRAAYTVVKLSNKTIRMFLDSGASCSVVCADYGNQSEIKPVTATKLINADGRNIISHGTTTMAVTLGDFSVKQVKQPFIVVEHLSTPVILGCDYLANNDFALDFQQGTFHRVENPEQMLQLLPAESTVSPLMMTAHKQF